MQESEASETCDFKAMSTLGIVSAQFVEQILGCKGIAEYGGTEGFCTLNEAIAILPRRRTG